MGNTPVARTTTCRPRRRPAPGWTSRIGTSTTGLANALPQTLAPALGGVLAINSANNQNDNLLLWVAAIACVVGAIVVLPIKKVR